jgi:hypothetical protein
VPRIGITGHMNLTESTRPLIEAAIRKLLNQYPADELIGVSCIAAGADSIFAQVVLDLGGQLEVILPSYDYRERKVRPSEAPMFDSLVERAVAVRVMPYDIANREAYEAANEAMLSSIDQLVAVWDGQSPADQGGTAAVVGSAEQRAIRAHIVWPEGAARA